METGSSWISKPHGSGVSTGQPCRRAPSEGPAGRFSRRPGAASTSGRARRYALGRNWPVCCSTSHLRTRRGAGEYNLADVVQAGNGTILAAIFEDQGQPATIARSEDGGLSWTFSELAEDDAMTDILPSALISGTLYAASASGRIFVSTDYGSTWSSLASNPPVKGTLFNLAQSDTGELFAGDFDGAVFRSSDDGATWAPIVECPASGINHLVWAAGSLLIGSDNGLWRWTPGPGCILLADASHGRVFTATAAGDVIYFGGTGGLYKITDGQVQKLASDQVMSLDILPGAPSIAIGVNSQQLLWWRTDNDAVQPLYRFPNVEAGQPSGDSSDSLWVATSRGLYRSDLSAWLAHNRH